jgi:hypothetical protein
MDEQDKNQNIGDHLKTYLRLEYNILRLQLTEKLSLSGSALIANLIVTFSVAFFAFFLSFSLGYYLAEKLGSLVMGFLAVAGVYLLLSLILIIFRSKILIKPLRDKIVEELLKGKDDSKQEA